MNVQTLRYYERRGLLHEPDRTLGGHRLYPPEDLTVLRIIKAAQRMGFTLDEVADLLEVSALRLGRRTDAGLQARARAKLAEVDAKLAELTTVRDTLRAALDAGCDDLVACAENPLLPNAIHRNHPCRCTRCLGHAAGRPGGNGACRQSDSPPSAASAAVPCRCWRRAAFSVAARHC